MYFCMYETLKHSWLRHQTRVWLHVSGNNAGSVLEAPAFMSFMRHSAWSSRVLLSHTIDRRSSRQLQLLTSEATWPGGGATPARNLWLVETSALTSLIGGQHGRHSAPIRHFWPHWLLSDAQFDNSSFLRIKLQKHHPAGLFEKKLSDACRTDVGAFEGLNDRLVR